MSHYQAFSSPFTKGKCLGRLLVCSLVSVQATDDFHLRRGKLEIEDTAVLIGISIIVTTRDGDQTTLHVLAQHNLSSRLAMTSSDFTDSLVIKHTSDALPPPICLNSSFRFSSILKEDADKEKLSKMHLSSAPTNLLSAINSHPSASSELTKRCTWPGCIKKTSPSVNCNSLKSMIPQARPCATNPKT